MAKAGPLKRSTPSLLIGMGPRTHTRRRGGGGIGEGRMVRTAFLSDRSGQAQYGPRARVKASQKYDLPARTGALEAFDPLYAGGGKSGKGPVALYEAVKLS
jgi:hypothetical protein